jgi:hypothetical protein
MLDRVLGNRAGLWPIGWRWRVIVVRRTPIEFIEGDRQSCERVVAGVVGAGVRGIETVGPG